MWYDIETKRVETNTLIYIDTYIYTYIHIYIYTYIHIYIPYIPIYYIPIEILRKPEVFRYFLEV